MWRLGGCALQTQARHYYAQWTRRSLSLFLSLSLSLSRSLSRSRSRSAFLPRVCLPAHLFRAQADCLEPLELKMLAQCDIGEPCVAVLSSYVVFYLSLPGRARVHFSSEVRL